MSSCTRRAAASRIRARFLDFAETIGLPARATERAIEEVLAVTEPVPDQLRAGALPLTDRTLRNVTRSLTRRRRDMQP
ncbi:MAG TPA: hypothetical protein GXZ30_05060 [Propionibacterium sp.]|nr:hypothetical protein [Propionibacterium sp.]